MTALVGLKVQLSLNGLFITAALLLLLLLCLEYEKRHGMENTPLLYIAPFALFFGFIGARLMYVTVCDALYLTSAEKWNLFDGGYSLFGAIFAAVATVLVFCLVTRRAGKILPTLDTLCAGAAAAIAAGRLGSMFSEDCLGREITSDAFHFFPIGMYSEAADEYYLAVFFLEAVGCVIIFFAIRYADKHINRHGVSTFMFFTLYCGLRTFLESLRTDSMYIGFVRISQVFAAVILIGLYIYINIKLCRTGGFRRVYLISYAVFIGALVLGFTAEFFMGSASEIWNSIKLLISCLVMTVQTVVTGYLYLEALLVSIRRKNKMKKPKLATENTTDRL